MYRIKYQDMAGTDRTLELLPGSDGVSVEFETEINHNVSITGNHESIFSRTLRLVSVDCMYHDSVRRKVETFMSFASKGMRFEFARDAAKATIITLGMVEAGETIESLTSELSFDENDELIVMASDRMNWDVVTKGETLQNDYPFGATVSHYYTFGNLLMLDNKFKPKKQGSTWSWSFDCVAL